MQDFSTHDLGNSYYGFRLDRMYVFSGLSEHVMEFRHIKTNAKVIYIPSESSQKTFNLSFDTPVLDNTGVRHIIEHSVLCGSRKYRSKDPFRDIANKSMATYMNAVTYPSYTAYPFTTNNEEDFFNLMDFYLDSTYNPMAIYDKRIFEAEGWHYEVDDDNNFYINGVVYNEMKKVCADKMRVVSTRSDRDVYPDTPKKYVSGGDVSYMTRLTYENFIKYYKKYYHPSNSCLVLFGDIDICKALCLVNSYYKNYERKEFKKNIYLSKNYPSCHYFESKYPATSYELKEESHIIKLTYRIPNNLSVLDRFMLDFITDYLTMGANPPLKKNIVKAHLADRVSLSCDFNKLGCNVSVFIEGVKKEDIDKVILIARDTLKEQADNFDKDRLKLCFDKFSFNYTNKKINDYGLYIAGFMARLNNNYVECFDYQMQDNLDEIKNDIRYHDSILLKSVFRTYIITNEPYINVFSPDINYGKRLIANENKRIKNAYLSLDDSSFEKIKRETKELKAYRNRIVQDEDLATIPKLGISSLSKEIKWIEPTRVTTADIPIKYFDDGMKDIVTLRFYFDLEGLTREEMKFAKIIADLFLEADTKKYSVSKIRDLNDELLLVKNRKLYCSDVTGDRLLIEVECKRKDVSKVMNLLIEDFKETMYNDEVFLRERLKVNMNSVAAVINSSPQNAVKILLNEGFSRSECIKAEWQSFNYINLVQDLLNVLNTGDYSLSGKLRRITKKIFSKNRLEITVITKDVEEIKNVLVTKFISLSKAIDRKRQDKYTGYDMLDTNSAIIINTMVNYVGIRYDLRELPIGRYKKKAIASILRNEYLWDEIRLKGGAYGAVCDYSQEGYLLAISYRDPEYKETYKVLKRMCLFLENYDKDVTDVIVKTYAEILKENSIYSVVDRVDDQLQMGITKEEYIDDIMDLLTLSVEDIHDVGKEMHKVLKDARCAAAGSEATIMQDSSRYQTIYRI